MTKVTGWDNGLSQDYDKGLGRWFANRLGARQQLRKDFEMTQVLIDRSTLEQLVGALESLDENTERPPERNCSCHISPPCGDCVDHSPLRESLVLTKEALTAGRAALAKAEPEEDLLVFNKGDMDKYLNAKGIKFVNASHLAIRYAKSKETL